MLKLMRDGGSRVSRAQLQPVIDWIAGAHLNEG